MHDQRGIVQVWQRGVVDGHDLDDRGRIQGPAVAEREAGHAGVQGALADNEPEVVVAEAEERREVGGRDHSSENKSRGTRPRRRNSPSAGFLYYRTRWSVWMQQGYRCWANASMPLVLGRKYLLNIRSPSIK